MIVLDNNEKDIVIPDYNDLENKPSINGVVLEGNKTAGELGIDIDTTNFYTKGQADDRFQPKGNYLTSVPDEYITETELNSKNYATNSYVNDEIGKLNSALSVEISKKQNTLVSGTNIKTINGESILGDGNLTIEGGTTDLSNYYTKGEVDNLINNVEVDLTGYATETYVSNNYQPKGDYLTSVPSEYITETELNSKNYATKSEIPTIPTNISAFTNDSGYITNSALNGYATETYVSNNYQPKGDYLTSVPSEYVTETELNDAIAGLGGGESVAYLIIKENSSENTYSYVGGSFEDVVNAYNNNKPYFIYVPNGAGVNYYSLAETTIITDNYIQCSSFAHTGATHTWRYWRLYPTSIQLYNQTTYEYATTTQLNSKQDTLVSGTNIKTINGESILGEGNLTIDTIPTMFIPQGASGTVDLSILTPVIDAIRNNKPWIVWGFMDVTRGNYNMVECSSFAGDNVTFYDTDLTNDFIRYWEINLTDGTFTRSDNKLNYATKSYVDTQIGDINTILENIIG